MKLKPGGQGGSNVERQRRLSEARIKKEMKMWRPFRICGLFVALIALIFTIVVLVNDYWIGKENSKRMARFLQGTAHSPHLSNTPLEPFQHPQQRH